MLLYAAMFYVQQLASHGLLDLNIKASGDTHIDDHHTNEDIALAIGTVIFFTYLKLFCNYFTFYSHSLAILYFYMINFSV